MTYRGKHVEYFELLEFIAYLIEIEMKRWNVYDYH